MKVIAVALAAAAVAVSALPHNNNPQYGCNIPNNCAPYLTRQQCPDYCTKLGVVGGNTPVTIASQSSRQVSLWLIQYP